MKILEIPAGGIMNDGITKSLISYYFYMDRSNLEIDFLSVSVLKDEKIKKQIESLGISILELPYRNKRPLKYFRELKKLIKNKQYDIVRVCGSSSIMALELCAAKQAKVKVRIAHSRNTRCDHAVLNIMLKPIFNRSYTHAFACGVDAGKWLFGKKQFLVIPNGKNISSYEFKSSIREKVRGELALKDGELALVHVGNFNEQKNHTYLIDIFVASNKLIPNSKLFLFGSGYLLESIRDKVKAVGLKDKIIFMGQRSNVNEYLNGMDIMLLPSHYEGLPNVIIEGQICGLPCIVSNKITSECAITNLVTFLPIDSTPDVWVEEIAKTKIIDRTVNKEAIIKEINSAGYNIEVAAENLRNLFFEMVNEQ
ncbi:MAG: glycosyltransferase family 1 protein [Bacilli bacterium]